MLIQRPAPTHSTKMCLNAFFPTCLTKHIPPLNQLFLLLCLLFHYRNVRRDKEATSSPQTPVSLSVRVPLHDTSQFLLIIDSSATLCSSPLRWDRFSPSFPHTSVQLTQLHTQVLWSLLIRDSKEASEFVSRTQWTNKMFSMMLKLDIFMWDISLITVYFGLFST